MAHCSSCVVCCCDTLMSNGCLMSVPNVPGTPPAVSDTNDMAYLCDKHQGPAHKAKPKHSSCAGTAIPKYTHTQRWATVSPIGRVMLRGQHHLLNMTAYGGTIKRKVITVPHVGACGAHAPCQVSRHRLVVVRSACRVPAIQESTFWPRLSSPTRLIDGKGTLG